jgi:hypothetical protein
MSSFDEYKKNSKRNSKKLLVNISARYDEELIDKMYEFAQHGALQNKAELQKRFDSIEIDDQINDAIKTDLQDNLVEENYQNELAVELVSEMLVVALYKTVEISIKNMMKVSELFSEKELKNTFRFEQLTQAIKHKLGVDLKTLNNFSEFNELRLINNCIKHSGFVSPDLANYPDWNKGEKIQNTYVHFQRINQVIRNFVNDFKESILKNIS